MLAVLGFFTDSAYALLAGTVGDWLKHSRGYVKFERYGSGLLFIGLGVDSGVCAGRKEVAPRLERRTSFRPAARTGRLRANCSRRSSRHWAMTSRLPSFATVPN